MKRWFKIVSLLLAPLLMSGAAFSAWDFGHPSPPPADQYLVAGKGAGHMTAQFFGTTTLLLRDEDHAVMVDALLSRPGLKAVLFGKLSSDPRLIADTLGRAGVSHVDLLLISHSHYDHVLDAPAIAKATGALLVGSPSTREVALGGDVPESSIRVINGGESLSAGPLSVRVFRSLHSPDDHVPGEIATPLRQPAEAKAYRQGGTFAFLIANPRIRILVHPSANFAPGMYRGVHADIVFLATGGLGRVSDDFAARYWHEVVEATGAKLVIPIHWDDFLLPIDAPQQPMRRFMDDFPKAIGRIEPLAKRDRVAIRYMPLIKPVDVEAATLP